jgi:hypothetical protein
MEFPGMRSGNRTVKFVGLTATLVMAASGAAFATGGPGTTPPSSDEIAATVYNAPDAAAAFEALPADQQAVFVERMDHWTAEEGSGEIVKRAPTAEEKAAMGPDAVTAGGCYSQYKYYKWKDVWINTGDTWMTANWCHNGSRVTSYNLRNQGGQGKKGIKYEGLGGQFANNVGWEVRQAQTFKFSIKWANANPCMQIRGGNGLYSFRANCNLG